jgi:hypothetical protein
MILKRFRLNPRNRKIDDLYGAIVAQSRRATFYVGYGVPDTMEGRFDLIVLHMFCFWRASIAEGRPHANSARTCSMFFAAILTPTCAKWASGIWPSQNECASLPKRFTEGRPPISPLLMPRTGWSLRRR